jgi:hypothetical protein
MKIAVLLYGRIHRYRELYYRFRNFFRNHDIDIFYSSDESPENELNEFIDLYRPIKVINDKITIQPFFQKYSYEYTVNVDSMYCHFMNKQRVFSLLEEYCKDTSTHYDCVFSTRLDIYYTCMLSELTINNNTIYVPNNHSIPNINDHIAYGSYESMKIYMNILSNCDTLLSKYVNILNPHLLTYYNLNSNTISVESVSLNYHLVSESGVLIPKGWVTDKTLPLP